MRTIAGVIIGLGLGILLMYFSVSAFRVSDLAADDRAGDESPCVGIVFAEDVSLDEQDDIAAMARDALPQRWLLRTARLAAGSVRETTPVNDTNDSGLPAPGHVLLWGEHPWAPEVRGAFGGVDSPVVLAYSADPVEWADCALTVPVTPGIPAGDIDPSETELSRESAAAAVLHEFVRLAAASADSPLPIRIDLRPAAVSRPRAVQDRTHEETESGSSP